MGNLFEKLPADFSCEVFENLVDSKNVKIERIISKGHTSPESGWYEQNTNEWVMVVQGAAEISFVDRPAVNLKAGDYLEIKAQQKHKVSWTDPEIETIWLAVHF
ncbi:cupin domain-containing protein [Psychromonas ossibalaenae]|uniref:cupin domain-containing protein n=1 Tax=Psychromonas ossibalaenae TaxID=444922 RepID=UPI00037DACF5|nr:cupin domain-containing protein [Psychromonas ossibalaenae]